MVNPSMLKCPLVSACYIVYAESNNIIETVSLLPYSTYNDIDVVVDVNEKLMTTVLYVSILTTLVMTGVAIGLMKRYDMLSVICFLRVKY